MADTRASSFLPTVKCSSCAIDLQIIEMASHVCSGPPPTGQPTPPPDNYGNFNRMPYRQPQSTGSSLLKPGRAMPPRVDTSAANLPFMPQDQLTPASLSPSRSASPMTPRSPFGRPLAPLRSATLPMPRSPPSPEILSSNLDSAFPPFPTSKNKQKPLPPNNGYGGGTYYNESERMQVPASPRGGRGVLQRMNTIAPGPFDINRSRDVSEPPQGRGHQKTTSGGTVASAFVPRPAADLQQRPSTANPGHQRTLTTSSKGSRNGGSISQNARPNGYGNLGPPPEPSPDPFHFDNNRSQTFPLASKTNEPPLRRPSEPYTGAMSRAPSNDRSWPTEQGRSSNSPPRQRKQSSGGPDLSRPLPPRGTSLIRPKTANKDGSAPPMPDLNLAAEFGVGNPYHTPNASQSSSASGYSQHSKSSSRSSPPRSGSSSSRRKPSDTSHVDTLMADLQASMAELQPREPLKQGSPPRQRAPRPEPLEAIPKFGPLLASPESPMDPSMISGRLSPIPLKSPSRPQHQHLQPRSKSPMRSATPDSSTRTRSPAPRATRPTTARGNCKGCGETIKGKSVSSADGRLTGRYHKDCFVCKTCCEPFQTATFYVLNDAPYCERHYHKLNGSVCKSCDKGIEGQYLESASQQKFHPACLKCEDCRRNLRNEYFEMNGRVYCERDAFRRAQQGRNLGVPGVTNRMERRTTRLMMM